MVKIIVVALLFVNLIACGPVEQASSREAAQPTAIFSCLSSQNQCQVATKAGDFSVQFSGQRVDGKIKTELPFQVQLSFLSHSDNKQLKTVDSYLEGKEMFMGKIPVFFQLSNNNTNIRVAESLLANCAEEVMTWRLWFKVELLVAGETQQQHFFIDFDSQRL